METTVNGSIPLYLADTLAHLRERSQSLHIMEVGHARLSGRLEKYGRLLGLAVVVLTTVAGTTVFTELGERTGSAAKITVGAIAALAAVLAAIKEQVAFGKSSADHEAAAAEYGALHHHVERKILDYERVPPPQGDLDDELDDLNKEEAALNARSPVLGGHAYDWGKNWVEAEVKARR